MPGGHYSSGRAQRDLRVAFVALAALLVAVVLVAFVALVAFTVTLAVFVGLAGTTGVSGLAGAGVTVPGAVFLAAPAARSCSHSETMRQQHSV